MRHSQSILAKTHLPTENFNSLVEFWCGDYRESHIRNSQHA